MAGETGCEDGLPVLFGSLVASSIPWVVLYWGVPLKRGVSFLERAVTYLHSSREGLFIEVLSAIFSALSCATYVAGMHVFACREMLQIERCIPLPSSVFEAA